MPCMYTKNEERTFRVTRIEIVKVISTEAGHGSFREDFEVGLENHLDVYLGEEEDMISPGFVYAPALIVDVSVEEV